MKLVNKASELVKWREREQLSRRSAPIALGCSRAAWVRWEDGVKRPPDYIRLAMQAYSDGHRIKEEGPTR